MIDPVKAQAVERFFGLLRHSKGPSAGHPFVLEPWQRDFILPLLCEVDEQGRRVYRQSFLAIAKKNGKSTIAAGLCLWMLLADGESSPEVYGAASSREQARIIFDQARQFVEASPVLRKSTRLYKHSIEPRDGSGVYRPLSADSRRQHGINPSFLVYDELHTALDRELFDTLATGMGARERPIMLSITTAGRHKTTVCYEQWEYTRRVAEGAIIDPSYLGKIYAADASDDPFCEETWAKANPNMGISIGVDYLRQTAERARSEPSFLPAFMQLHCNLWVSGDTRWLETGAWDACQGEMPSEEVLRVTPCFGGLDLSSAHDLTSLALVWVLEGRYFARVYFWLPEETVEARARKDKVNYRAWVQEGHARLTSGNVIDLGQIIADMQGLATQYKIAQVAFDRWGAMSVSNALTEIGMTLLPMGQGFASMAGPTSELTRLIRSKAITHEGNPVLNWNVANVVCETDAAGNMKPSKQKSRERIDGAVALIMAIDRAMRGVQKASIYETRDLLVL